MEVRISNNSKNELPKYQTAGAAGLDICANMDEIVPCEGVRLISTGLSAEIPEGYEIQVRPRSGLALKHGVTVLNSPGTIDSDYRGEIKVILINHGPYPFVIKEGDRIAQLVLSKVEKIEWSPVLVVTETTRGEGGFGSTGK